MDPSSRGIDPSSRGIDPSSRGIDPSSRGIDVKGKGSGNLNTDIVKKALEITGGNKAKAARYLGIGRATLYRFLERYPQAGDIEALRH
ncbi:MAG: helix-turn-helix domain-containing protein [Desulfamplus sp.]|nr:helix-turn-helix domain-containing protein [Desulfamplus sp.]